MRSLNGGELQTLVEVREESIAQTVGKDSAVELSGERGWRAQIVTKEIAAEEIVFESRVNPVMLSPNMCHCC